MSHLYVRYVTQKYRAAAIVFDEYNDDPSSSSSLLACVITHVQSTVFEPCPRLNIKLNHTMDPLRRVVGGSASTTDVVCRLFGTTITTVTRNQSPVQHICAESTDNQIRHTPTCEEREIV